MKNSVLLLLFTIITFVYAQSQVSNYIVSLTKPVTNEKLSRAKSDIESFGGKILYELKLGINGFAVSLPASQLQSIQIKDYIDFIEADSEVNI